MSMWTILRRCMKLRASRIWPVMTLHLFSFSWKVGRAMVLKRSLPPRYSVSRVGHFRSQIRVEAHIKTL